ncbi:AMP-binding protein [Streptomyces sp. NPDC058206]|uniref:AMP-binding protein n=1 Tax=Streptomyces sp. NPDC058206 TaxID=3346382 RepID=UPI0036EB03D7
MAVRSTAWRSPSGAALRKWRDETPEALAVIAYRAGTGVRRLTYREFSDYVERFARELRELEVGPGQVVAMQLPNWWQVSALLLACGRVGAVVAPIMMTIGPRELERILSRLDASVCVTVDQWGDVQYSEAVAEMAPRLPKLRHRVVINGGDAPGGTVNFGRHFEETPWEQQPGGFLGALAEDPDRVAVVLFTSAAGNRGGAAEHHAQRER